MKRLEFYVNNLKYIERAEDIDISFVPILLRRRLTLLNKASFCTLHCCYDDRVENIVYSSADGGLDRLESLIAQYKTDNEVSPSNFSSSVHNGMLGLFSVLKKYKKTYNAISACENSLSSGLLSAVVSDKRTLYCYSDMFDEIPLSVTLDISKFGADNSQKWAIILRQNDVSGLEHESFIRFIKGVCDKVDFYNYTLERV